MNSDKCTAYEALVVERKACLRCAHLGLTNPSNAEVAEFDGAQIGPWTRWLGDLNADVMIIGQEWGDVASFARQRGLDDESPTNRALRELLAHTGIAVEPAPKGTDRPRVFLTNAALCLKRGGAQARVHSGWFANCGPAFLRPQIELVRPQVVVTLGEHAYRATMLAFGNAPRRFRAAVESHSPVSLLPETVLVPVYHCGRHIMNTHRKRPQQFDDWLRVKAALVDRGTAL